MIQTEAPYSLFRHAVRAVWLNRDPSNCRVALFHAYYDASGTEHQPGSLLAVAGVVASVEQWEAIERDWRTVLTECGVPHLHMNEFAHSTGAFAQGWKRNEPKRAAFLARLIGALRSRIEYATVFDVLPADFDEVDKEYRLTT